MCGVFWSSSGRGWVPQTTGTTWHCLGGNDEPLHHSSWNRTSLYHTRTQHYPARTRVTVVSSPQARDGVTSQSRAEAAVKPSTRAGDDIASLLQDRVAVALFSGAVSVVALSTGDRAVAASFLWDRRCTYERPPNVFVRKKIMQSEILLNKYYNMRVFCNIIWLIN